MKNHIPIPFEVHAHRVEGRILHVLSRNGPIKRRPLQQLVGSRSGPGVFAQVVSRMNDAGSITVDSGQLVSLVDPSIRVFEAIDPVVDPDPGAFVARIPIDGDLRAYVWDKTGGLCWYCGVQTNPFRDFACDHVIPVVGGGTNDLSNLVPACRRCNSRKHAMSVERYRTRLGGAIFWFERVGKS